MHPLRIAIGGFLHESHSFAPQPTTWDDFLHPGGFPGLQLPPTLLQTLRNNPNAIGGAIHVAEHANATLHPLAWCIANPAGPVDDHAFERIAALICAPLAYPGTPPIDGIYLDLHGAALATSFPDAEAELLRRIRAIAPHTPIATSLDPHANLTPDMVAHTDLLAPYLTYPHIDMPGAGARAMHLLLHRIERKHPFAKAYRQLDFLIPITSQCTLVPPMRPIMDARTRILAETGALDIAWCFGFPYADFPGCGPAFAVYADTDAIANEAANRFQAILEAAEPRFAQPIDDAATTTRQAIALATTPHPIAGPVIIADTQDNPGGGGHGDTTGLLAELVRQQAPGAVLCLINDARSAAACHQAGKGATLPLTLGGKSDNAPHTCTATVLQLSDGNFTLTGPMSRGNQAALGPTALIETQGVKVVVVSRKMQAYDQAILQHLGLDPTTIPILALKSSVHFRAHFAPIAREILLTAAPGPVVANPATLPFTNLRPTLRTHPKKA